MTKFLIEFNESYIYLGDIKEQEAYEKYIEYKNLYSKNDKIYLIPLHRQKKVKSKEKALIIKVDRSPSPVMI